MLIRGEIQDHNGVPAPNGVVRAFKRLSSGRMPIAVEKTDSQFALWMPIEQMGYSLEMIVESQDGKQRAKRVVHSREYRGVWQNGMTLRLAPANRTVRVKVRQDGENASGAQVVLGLFPGPPMQATTDEEGQATFALLPEEQIQQLTAWTSDHRIGGYDFTRKPHHDPLGTEFEVELAKGRDQLIRLLNVEDGLPIEGVALNLFLGTGPPNYNFVAVPDSFPHLKLTTDQAGQAICNWFPLGSQQGAYVDVIDPRWATAIDELDTADDGAMVMKLRRRVARKQVRGQGGGLAQIIGNGAMVELYSFQGEGVRKPDRILSFINPEGEFYANCLPGSTYFVTIDDTQFVSNSLELTPSEIASGQMSRNLIMQPGRPVEILVTTGRDHQPLGHANVSFIENRMVTWFEKGKRYDGHHRRGWWVMTDANGIARTLSKGGAILEVSAQLGDWRSASQEVQVLEFDAAKVTIHRTPEEEAAVIRPKQPDPSTDPFR